MAEEIRIEMSSLTDLEQHHTSLHEDTGQNSRGSNSNRVTGCVVAHFFASTAPWALGTCGRVCECSQRGEIAAPTVHPPMLTTLPSAPTAKLEKLSLSEHHWDGAFSCA